MRKIIVQENQTFEDVISASESKIVVVLGNYIQAFEGTPTPVWSHDRLIIMEENNPIMYYIPFDTETGENFNGYTEHTLLKRVTANQNGVEYPINQSVRVRIYND